MFWMFMTALWIVMLAAPMILLAALLPTGRECPRCSAETLPIRSRLLHPLRGFVRSRWCMACGWEGYTRNAPSAPVPGLELSHEPVTEVDDDAAWRGERHNGAG